MEATDFLDTNSILFLERVLRQGQAILFTGAGFSRGATNIAGSPIPLASELKSLLWDIAFPGEIFDTSSDLGEVFDVAIRTRRAPTQTLLERMLTADAKSVPEFYSLYAHIPWFRIYTLNIDTLYPVITATFAPRVDIDAVSAIRSQVPPPDRLSVVYLNGMLVDYPDVTFSPPQYGRRAAKPDFAYATLARDLVSKCVIFIGTQIDEPPLWQHVAMRGDRPPGHELRPRSFLVTPSIPVARKALLEQFNVRHIPLDAEAFANLFLKVVAEERIVRPFTVVRTGQPFDNLDHMPSEPREILADFLLGREPTWADIKEGFAVTRDFEDDLLHAANDRETRLVFVVGTAGSGKSTVLRRLALALHAEGKSVLWLRSDAPDSMAQVRNAALAANAEIVAIDNADRYGERGLEMIRALAEAPDGPTLVCAYRSTSFDDHAVDHRMGGATLHTAVVPLLADGDIDKLLDALTAANRLGRLVGLPREQQFRAFKDRASRQLLVALFEATSGQRFEDKIASECSGIASDLQMAYAVIALATANRYALRIEELLAALSEVSARGLDIADRLVRQHLVLRSPDGRLLARHPVIAREVMTYYKQSGQLGEAVGRLAFVLASKTYPGMPRTTERRLLNLLLSHEYIGKLVDSRTEIRAMYESLEALLRHDPHYWLQRGSYELERGELSLADNFLSQARNLSTGDFMVDTEWAYLMLERGCREPSTVEAAGHFNEGFELLLDVIDRAGERTPNTYVVLAQKSIEWARVGPLSLEERKRLLEVVRGVLSEASRYHGANKHFRAARDELERTYLRLAVA